MQITKKQFEYYLFKFKRDGIVYSYKSVDMPDTYEYVYEIRLKGCYDLFYLYSSIGKSSGVSRAYSTDRIRLVRLKNGNFRRVFQINRSKGWDDRLGNGLRSAISA